MPIRLPKSAGKPYRPSNGTEGEMFMEMFCDRCSKLSCCRIVGLSMAVEKDDPEYPKEWVFDSEGCPTCTAFEEVEQ